MGSFKEFGRFCLYSIVIFSIWLFAAGILGGFIGVLIYKNSFFEEFSKFSDLSKPSENWWFLIYLPVIVGAFIGGYIGIFLPLYAGIPIVAVLVFILAFLGSLGGETREKKEKRAAMVSHDDGRTSRQILEDEINKSLFGSGENIEYMSCKELRERLSGVKHIIKDMTCKELREIAEDYIDELEEEEDEDDWEEEQDGEERW